MDSLQEMLKRILLIQRIREKQIGDVIGISQSFISKIKNGKVKRVPFDVMIRVECLYMFFFNERDCE